MRSNNGVTINIKDISYIPYRVDVPVVPGGFVYLLVSVKKGGFKICFVDKTEENLLVDLSRHNCGHYDCITQRKDLRPWAVAAFCYGFAVEHQREDLKQQIESHLHLDFRVDTLVDEFEKNCKGGNFGLLKFVKCGSLMAYPD